MYDSGQDLMKAFYDTRQQLNDCLKSYKIIGRTLAKAEMLYKIEYRKEVFRLHIEDKVAWTACNDLAKGEDKVAELRMKRDICKSDYDCCYERILQLKIEIKILDNEIMSERG